MLLNIDADEGLQDLQLELVWGSRGTQDSGLEETLLGGGKQDAIREQKICCNVNERGLGEDSKRLDRIGCKS